LMPGLIQTGRAQSKQQLEELYFLYNDRLLPRETKSTCGSCVSRVFKRMVNYYNELNGKA
jgi:hypothetical protein